MMGHAPQSHSTHEDLAIEAISIFAHERASEILLNDWVQDSSLPIPSENFILFLAIETMTNAHWLALAGSTALEESIAHIVKVGRSFTEQAMRELAEDVWPEIQAMRAVGTAGIWLPIIRRFHRLDSDATIDHQIGQRATTRRLLESLFLRSIFFSEGRTIRALGDAIDAEIAGTSCPCLLPNQIASWILEWQTFVRKELGEAFSKSQMKGFLSVLKPSCATATDKVWSGAWRIAGWGNEGDGKGKREKDAGIALASRLISRE